jgi:hypothetical protein
MTLARILFWRKEIIADEQTDRRHRKGRDRLNEQKAPIKIAGCARLTGMGFPDMQVV